MNHESRLKDQRIETKKEFYKCGNKNQGGAAFNIVSLNYENNREGQALSRVDNDAMVRALLRSKVLDAKNNGGYNILTGTARSKIPVPHHERYNPISNAGQAVMS